MFLLPKVSAETRAPAPGYYPVPAHRGHGAVEREWDGDAWGAQAHESGATLAHHKRHPLRFLRERGWLILLVYLLAAGASMALIGVDPDRRRVAGIQLLLPLTATVAALMPMLAAYRYFGNRLRFEQLHEGRGILKWGIISGLVGVAIGMAVELGVPTLFLSNAGDPGWSALAGPAEETGKLVVPAILWFHGLYRSPRAGFLLVVISAATFGVVEGGLYAVSPSGFSPQRTFIEIIHVLLTGFIAAVAWRAAWKRPSLFTAAGIAAWAFAMAMHSFNDLSISYADRVSGLGSATAVVLVVMYFAIKHAGRQLVPPDNVAGVSPRWRPRAPRAG
jgi:hypothetical protein